jgi:hypothetical protein
MSQIIPIFIPTYISDQNYNPTRVQPRLLYYNGQVDCESYYLVDGNNVTHQTTTFPYFDNYSASSGSQFPTTGSKSLLFFNEQASYGSTPTNSLFSEYWSNYVNLLYNPRTRLVNASAIIPLAEYFDMELNDIVEFRGNYYHLRAINDYNLKNGECKIQLLGPILNDALPFFEPVVPTTTTTTTTSTTSTSTTTTSTTTSTTTTTEPPETGLCFTLTYETSISEDLFVRYRSTLDTIVTERVETLPTRDNLDGTYTAGICVLQGSSYATPVCVIDDGIDPPYEVSCDPYSWISGGGCEDGFDCIDTTTTTTTTTSSTTTTTGGSATLDWSFTETGGTVGNFDLYVNASNVESRSNTSSGTYTVYVGDTINVEVYSSGCDGFDDYANAYCTGIINDANCAQGSTTLFTANYTVVSGDIGTTLNLDCFASCDSACI